jgi:hypothetical protein
LLNKERFPFGISALGIFEIPRMIISRACQFEEVGFQSPLFPHKIRLCKISMLFICSLPLFLGILNHEYGDYLMLMRVIISSSFSFFCVFFSSSHCSSHSLSCFVELASYPSLPFTAGPVTETPFVGYCMTLTSTTDEASGDIMVSGHYHMFFC